MRNLWCDLACVRRKSDAGTYSVRKQSTVGLYPFVVSRWRYACSAEGGYHESGRMTCSAWEILTHPERVGVGCSLGVLRYRNQ